MEKKDISACPLNCWDTCGFTVTVENDTVVKVAGNKQHPVTKGHICNRGRMLEARTNAPSRITKPLKKNNGDFVEISWDQALDEIAEKLLFTKNRYGSTAVLHSHDYSNNGLLKNLDHRFFNCYGGVTEVVGSLCWGAGIEAQIRDFGNSAAHAPEDIFNSKNTVIWGRNAASTNIHLYANLIEAKKRGIHVTVIDPLYHQTAKLADVYIAVRPGMDGLLAIGVIKQLKKMNLVDEEFIRNHTYGYNEFMAYIDEIELSEIVSQTSVSEETINLLASHYSSGPTSTYLGLGMQRYANGGSMIRLIDALVAISGNVGIKGGGANYGHLPVGQSFDVSNLTLSNRRFQNRVFTRMNQAEKILSEQDPPIKMAFVTRGNPLTQLPDTNRVEEAFTSIETLVVIDQFMTDTAELADYILPCTTVFEEEDIYYASMYHSYVNYGPRLVTPKGEARADHWIWTELANRLGFGEDFAFSDDEFLKMGLQSLEKQGITLEKIKAEGFVKLPIQDVPWSDYQFKTPSGKYEFSSTKALKDGESGKLTFQYPLESINSPKQTKFPYHLLSKHPSRSNHSQNYHLINDSKVVVEVSEKIAKEKCLSEGEEVTIWNDRGSITGSAKIMKNSHDDTINIDEGRWKKLGGSVNVLTSSGESDIGQGGIQYDCLVNIRKKQA
ncbi:molybdopterin-dependent oxidoreductase [Anaerobacillus isosaccharinicus]|uniref:Molybdopterin-dependent oxidoreductase n=1 Tax=Anaerobacillus isosaccharinicus TaxID=1532552 RepID=A0A7S7LA96_9BACI|nr:molybdopterin-dependent oxidoreductase [Anaerobacillus isosaccharinicus]MBA5584225.1 molybdopterin-dependent oxidoreductase [Anaerobacillus isosaccharinicus]QOY37373.1 molybdopterin-dependent oxidoreductase [Anaerobacillus isosaccharinicus]